MPGVPSSRGCEACRKQKKRCDQQQPTCSRCKRLGISCIGSGKKRFEFRDPQIVAPDSGKVVLASSQTLPRSPSPSRDAATHTAASLISLLEVTDLRYDLKVYGAFLSEIPRRLGKNNKALDAATRALIASFPRLHTRQNSPEALARHGEAIIGLRDSLNDPEQAQTTDTLIAIYLMIIYRGWIGTRDEKHFSHGPGMAYILNIVASKETQSELDKQVFTTLCIPVLMERIANPNIYLGPWFWKLHSTNGPRRPINPTSKYISDLRLQDLARIVDYIREPEAHMIDIEFAYYLLKSETGKLRAMWDAELLALGMDPTSVPTTSSTSTTANNTSITNINRRYQTGYITLLALAILLNTFLRIAHPHNVQLRADHAPMLPSLLYYAHLSLTQRPLGAAYMPMCLLAASVSTSDPVIKSQCASMIAEYEQDFADSQWAETGMWLQSRIDLLRVHVQGATVERPLDKTDLSKVSCVIL